MQAQRADLRQPRALRRSREPRVRGRCEFRQPRRGGIHRGDAGPEQFRPVGAEHPLCFAIPWAAPTADECRPVGPHSKSDADCLRSTPVAFVMNSECSMAFFQFSLRRLLIDVTIVCVACPGSKVSGAGSVVRLIARHAHSGVGCLDRDQPSVGEKGLDRCRLDVRRDLTGRVLLDSDEYKSLCRI